MTMRGLMSSPFAYRAVQRGLPAAGFLIADLGEIGEVQGYERSLDLREGTASVRYEAGDPSTTVKRSFLLRTVPL